MTPGRRRPILRLVLGVLAALVLLVVLGVVAAALFVDPNSFRPRLETAAQQATGRALTLRGPIHLSYGLRPTFTAEDIALANMPGGSRPAMLTAQKLDVTVALIPLLSGQLAIVRADLVHPDILLETDAAGRPNWAFSPAGSPAAMPSPSQPSAPQAAGQPGGLNLSVGTVRVTDGTVLWRDGKTGRTVTVGVPSLTVDGASSGDAMTIAGKLVLDGKPVTLSGRTGPMARLFNAAVAEPWPVQLTLAGEGDQLSVSGTVAQPLEGKGYALQVQGRVTNLAAFAALLPQALPPLREATFSAHLNDSGKPLPDIGAVAIHLSGLDLAPRVPGLTIITADIMAPAAAQPVRADVHATLRGAPVHAVLGVGTLAALLPNAAPPAPLPVSAVLEAGGAQLRAQGTVADPSAANGLDVQVSGRVPELEALQQVTGAKLPGWKDIALAGHVTGDFAPGGTVGLHKLSVAMPQLQLGGDLDVAMAARPAVRGSLTAETIDLDALIASIPRTSGHATPAGAAAPARPPERRVIPDTPLDLAPLRMADADLRLSIASLQTGGQTYRNVAGHLVLQDGRLTLDPFTGDVPGGKLDARLALDASSADPPVALRLHAPALALQPFAVAFHAPQAISGTAFIDLDMTGRGKSPQAIAASANGRLGVAVAGGTINPTLMGGVLKDVLAVAQPLADVFGGTSASRTVPLNCLALRLNATNGVANVTALLVDSTTFQVQGGGTINLGTEQLALRLRPLAKVGPGIVVPVNVSGTMLNPHAAVNAGATGKEVALGALSGALIGATGGAALALFGTGNGADACGPALAVARGAAAAPAANRRQQAPAHGAKRGNPLDALKGLLGQ